MAPSTDSLPPLEDFTLFESAATVVAGGMTYPDCGVIAVPPSGARPSGLAGQSADDAILGLLRIDVRKDQVPALPVGSTITVALDGAPGRTYFVRLVVSDDPQYHAAWCD